ncbi:MAG: radical SAM protein [Candidatus Omnitrophica bacterium]|nr:radical SAM protein [Candidatus Omnitrophota bacterium]
MNIARIIKSIGLTHLGLPRMPMFVTYLVTWRCNGRCVFCDVWRKRAEANDELNLDEISKIFCQIKNPDVLRITGGEPFLRKDLLDVINAIDDVGRPSMIHITSNGMLTERIVQVMEALTHPKKIHIKISIDHVGKRHDDIRGVPGAYEKAMRSIKELVRLRKVYKFHVGVNQAIVNESDIEAYGQLKQILSRDNVPIYPTIALQPQNSLYSDKKFTDPNGSVKPFGEFSKKGLKDFISSMLEESKGISDLPERVIDRYHLQGMYNRIVCGQASPNPPCVALNSHIRILPNGDVPVCLYNGTVVGNLKQYSLKEIWHSLEVKKQRAWVAQCPGCWQSCEAAVNAIYTGDIWKGFLPVVKKG